MVIGLANIIPGVSGGTMMVSMNIYDKLIHCITHLFSEFKKNVLFLLPIFIGMVVAIIGSSFGIEALFDNYPIQTNLAFIGLILGGLPVVFKKVKKEKTKLGHIISFAFFFLLVVGLALVGSGDGANKALTTSFEGMLVLFGIGVIASATMVIPGVSGSMVLLLLGYYNPILSAITDFLRALADFDMEGLVYGFKILVPFGIGVVFGIFAIAKLVEIIFNKCPLYAYWGIIGLIVSSPIAILVVNELPVPNVVSILTGAIAFVAGLFVSMKLGE
ncbi:MAG: DUF368 domain-containing protein [Pseudobutyrivibrio sp.]|nr:DUF368 domain-containing protein [Pseudobutyrivibrio sp.]